MEWTKPRKEERNSERRDVHARKILPMKVRETAPGKMKWSYY